MKVLQITTSINWGAVGRIAEQIGEKVLSNGGESYIAYGRYQNKSKSIPIKIGGRVSLLTNVIEARLFDREGLAARESTKILVDVIKKINPDIIHLHNIHGYYLNYPILFEYLKKEETPVVWTLHDCWAFTGHCSHFVTADCYKWKKGCERCPLLHTYPNSIGYDGSKRNYFLKKKYFTSLPNVTIVAVSNWLAQLAQQSFLGQYPIKVIHNGVDLNVFRPQSNGKGKTKNRFKLLGIASVWTKEKGIEEFIKLSSFPNYDITLIGTSPEIEKFLPRNITCVRRTEDINQLVRYYSDADVLINPTYNDSFPTINLESIACGTPIITYKTGGSPEAIGENNGIVVEKGNFDKLVEAIEEIRSKSLDERLNQKDQCRDYATRNFDKNTCFNKYLEIYNNIVGGGSL